MNKNVEIIFEIEQKELGNWNIPINIRITFPNTGLNPHLVFNSIFDFPGQL